MQISGSIRCCLMTAGSATAAALVSISASSPETDVFEIDRLLVDAHSRRRDPGGVLAGLEHRVHQRGDEGEVGRARQPLAFLCLPFLVAHDAALGGPVSYTHLRAHE